MNRAFVRSRRDAAAAIAAAISTAASVAIVAVLAVAPPAAAAPAFALGADGFAETLDETVLAFREICAGDFDGDGDVDVAASIQKFNAPARVTKVAMGDGVGAVGEWTDAVLSNGGCEAANLDPDAASELLVGGPGGDLTRLDWNKGGFDSSSVPTPFSDQVMDVEVGDLTGDGITDIAAVDEGEPGMAAVLVGDGNGAFTPVPNHPVATGSAGKPEQVRVADLNGDGRSDVLVRHASGTTLTVLRAGPGGDGDLLPGTGVPELVTLPIGVADLDDDGRQDLVRAAAGRQVVVAPGDGAGGFGAGTFSPSLPGTYSFAANAVADFDGDGEEDVVVGSADLGAGPLRMFAYTGTGSAAPWVLENPGAFGIAMDPASHAIEAIEAADLNGDAHPDALLGDENGRFAILVNTTPIAPVNTLPPQLAGTARVGDTLTCEPGAWTGKPSFEFAWLRGGVALGGETANTYTVEEVDIGSPLVCRVTATNTGGTVVATSPSVVAVPAPAPPQNVEPPRVLGEPRVGSNLACEAGTWTTGGDFAYAWLRDGALIAGAASAAYTPVATDAGQEVACRVTLIAADGSAEATSDPVTIASEPPVEHELSVALVGDGAGQVSGPGIDCDAGGGDCTETYAEGAQVELTAVASGGSTFGGWSGACAGAATCELDLEGDRQVVAAFALLDEPGDEGPDDNQPDQPDQPGQPPVAGPPPAQPTPSNSFRLGKPKPNKRAGTVRLEVAVPGPGTVVLLGSGVKARLRTVAAAGAVRLTVASSDVAAKRLKRRGRTRVRVDVTYIPNGGAPSSRRLFVELRRGARRGRS